MLPTILLPLTLALLTHALPSRNGIPITVSPGIPYVPPGHAPVSCTNISTGISSHCFTNLTIPRYLRDWNISYSRELCAPSQTWSNCYLNYAYTINITNTTTTMAGFDGHPRPQITAENLTTLHDCSSLNGNSSTNGCPPPQLSLPPRASPQTFYTVLNIYNVHQHLVVWSQAISANASLAGINYLIEESNGTVNPALDSATGLLQSVVARFGRSGPADAALVNLLYSPLLPPDPKRSRPTADIVGANGETGTPQLTARQWVPLLVRRLAQALVVVMEDLATFEHFVKGGYYSGTGRLAVVGLLERGLANPVEGS